MGRERGRAGAARVGALVAALLVFAAACEEKEGAGVGADLPQSPDPVTPASQEPPGGLAIPRQPTPSPSASPVASPSAAPSVSPSPSVPPSPNPSPSPSPSPSSPGGLVIPEQPTPAPSTSPPGGLVIPEQPTPPAVPPSASPSPVPSPSPQPPPAPPTPSPSPSPSPEPSPTPGTTPEPPGGDPRCEVSEILEPSCGLWWGASPWQGDPEPLEQAANRKLDIVYTWNGIDQTEIPTDAELEYAEEGRLIHANIEAKRFNERGHPEQDYADIIAGRFDRSLTAQARRIAGLEYPIFVTFDHEADANKRYDRRGSPEEFVRAWRHIVDLYRENGAENVVWVWNVTGWPANLSRLPSLWPGNDYVDWISWEAYNMTGCELMPHWDEVTSFEEALSPAYEWIQEEGPEHGIDPDKPVMIGEMGTVPIPGDPMATAKWYADIPEVLKRHERVKAVKMWDGKTAPTCDFRVREDGYAQWGYGLAGRHPYIAVPERVKEIVQKALETKEQLRTVQDEVHGRPRRGE